jgi:hypothetical protein
VCGRLVLCGHGLQGVAPCELIDRFDEEPIGAFGSAVVFTFNDVQGRSQDSLIERFGCLVPHRLSIDPPLKVGGRGSQVSAL